MAERRYTEAEAAQIIGKVAEMSRGSSVEDGVTLPELQKVAEELGLDPQMVAMAAERTERDAALDGGQTELLGAPPQYELERVFEGGFADEGWMAAVAEMDRVYGKGRAKGAGGTRTWHRKMDFGWVTLTATTLNGRTQVRFMSHIDNGIGWGMAAMAGVTILSLSTIFENFKLPGWGIVAVVLAAIFVAAYSFHSLASGWLKADQRKANAALDQVAAALKADSLRGRLATATPVNEQVEAMVEERR